MQQSLLSLLLALAASSAFAAETASEDRSGSPNDFPALNADEQAEYQAWRDAQSIEPTSTYQQPEGPNTMDISSDFSM